MKRAPLVLACLFMHPSGVYGPPPCEARLELLRQEQFLTITGRCRSLLAAPARYRYQLVVQRRSSTGQSRNTQGGAFALAARQNALLSQVRLTASPNDIYSARLIVFDDAGRIVAQDSTGS